MNLKSVTRDGGMLRREKIIKKGEVSEFSGYVGEKSKESRTGKSYSP